MKRIVIDLDNTISITVKGNYQEAIPVPGMVNKIKEYKESGFEIIIYSSRNMRTYEGNIGKINIHTLPVIIEWLNKFNIPFDEIHIGKPWCGENGFYVDDRAIRPDEFKKLSYGEISELLGIKK